MSSTFIFIVGTKRALLLEDRVCADEIDSRSGRIVSRRVGRLDMDLVVERTCSPSGLLPVIIFFDVGLFEDDRRRS